MSLHKKLVAAFKKVEPGLKERAYLKIDYEPENGYTWKKINFCVVFNSAGELVDVEQPPWRSGGKRRRSLLLVPQKQMRGHGGTSGFLWGQSLYALGLGKAVSTGGVKASADRFNIFRTFHRAALGNAKSPSLRAFLLFLQKWDPDAVHDLDRVAEVAGGSIAFRFQYEDCFLHENHSARVIWARLLNSTGAGTGGVALPSEELDED